MVKQNWYENDLRYFAKISIKLKSIEILSFRKHTAVSDSDYAENDEKKFGTRNEEEGYLKFHEKKFIIDRIFSHIRHLDHMAEGNRKKNTALAFFVLFVQYML